MHNTYFDFREAVSPELHPGHPSRIQDPLIESHLQSGHGHF